MHRIITKTIDIDVIREKSNYNHYAIREFHYSIQESNTTSFATLADSQ